MQATSRGRAIAWAFLVLLGLANIAGYAFDLYQRFWWFDRVLHAATIFAATLWLALFVLGRAFQASHAVLVVLLVASAGLAIGAVWELAEWAFDQIAPGNVVKGKYDTVIDLVMDTAGALLAGRLSLAFLRARSIGNDVLDTARPEEHLV